MVLRAAPSAARVAVVLAALCVFCVLPAAAVPTAALAAPDPDVRGLRKDLDKALIACGADYKEVARWCERNDLPGDALMLYVRALRFRPEDDTIREKLGYERQKNEWVWPEPMRMTMREQIHATREGREIDKRDELIRQAHKKMVDRLVGIARAATPPKEMDPDAAKELQGIAHLTWRFVLEVDPRHVDAHISLGHPRLGVEYVSPEALPFLKVRAERLRAAREIWTSAVDVRTRPEPGKVPTAVAGRYVVCATQGMDTAVDLARTSERTSLAFLQTYRLDPTFAERTDLRMLVFCEDVSEMEFLLGQLTSWSEGWIQKQSHRWASLSMSDHEIIARVSNMDAGRDQAANRVVRYLSRGMREYLETHTPEAERQVEAWLEEAIAMDIVMRLTGQYLTVFVSTSGTAQHRPVGGGEAWIEVARTSVELDDDLPLSALVQRDLNSLGTYETSKAFAFLQFLFESDRERAGAFVLAALNGGAKVAAHKVYTKTLEDLDAEYRNWMIVTR